MAADKSIFLVSQLDPAEDDPDREALYDLGVVATVLQLLKLPDGTVRVLVEGKHRATLTTLHQDAGHLTAEIRAGFALDSHLRIRCDKIYRRFFISRLRGDADGRGRGKGYAGLRLEAGDATELEVRGMEAVRSDFTPLARRFQRELIALLFADADLATLRAFCADTAARLVGGELDAELVYRKVLRRPAGEYDSETPQVRAARQLGWHDRGGPIEYVMTSTGAEPIVARTAAPLDYNHYRERQLVPIAQAVANVLGTDVDGWFKEPGQLGLFPKSEPAPR